MPKTDWIHGRRQLPDVIAIDSFAERLGPERRSPVLIECPDQWMLLTVPRRLER
jgi:hypothetical protein